MEKTHKGEKRPRMGFFIFGEAHTVLLYGFLPSADMGQVVYCLTYDILPPETLRDFSTQKVVAEIKEIATT
jgi:uncharacterized membrane protein